jgi:hypothetical protein
VGEAPDLEVAEPPGAPAEPLPDALRRALRRALGLLLMFALIMGALAYDGHRVLPGVIPLLSAGVCLLILATLARPSPEGAGRVFVQLVFLGCAAPLCALAVIAQYHYSDAVFGGQATSGGWQVTLSELGELFRVPHRSQDLAFVFAVSTAAAISTYAFAPGRRHLRAVLITPLPSLASLIVIHALQSQRDWSYQPPLLPQLGLFALGVFSLTIAWSLVFLVSERYGPGVDDTWRDPRSDPEVGEEPPVPGPGA